MMSRIVLVVLFWVTLVVAAITMTVPQAMKGGVWEGLADFVQQCLTNDIQKRDAAFRKKQKIIKSYVQMIKVLYGTRFLMAEDAADLAEKYGEIVRNSKKDNSGISHALMDNEINVLNSQAASLREFRGLEALELTDAMINRFRDLERKLREQRSGREIYQEQIDKLAALKDRYSSTLEKAESQRDKVREMDEKIRSLNERMKTSDRTNAAAKDRIAAMQERMASRTEKSQEKVRSVQEGLDAMKERQQEQKSRMDALQDRINARMGR